MNIETVKLDELTIDPANLRKHTPENLERIRGSLLRFGQQIPLVIDSNKVVRVGNGRLSVMRQIGMKTCLVVQTDLEGTELAAFAVADNKSVEGGDWEMKGLAEFMKSLGEEDETLLMSIGFDEKERDNIISQFGFSEPIIKDDKPVVPAGNESSKPAENIDDDDDGHGNMGKPRITYTIVFDNEEQQDKWFEFMGKLKARYPDAETIAERLDGFIAESTGA